MSEEYQALSFVAFNEKILSYWGMWPVVKEKTQLGIIRHWTFTGMVFILMSFLVFGQLCDMFTMTDVISFSENSTLMFTTISLMCKLINMTVKREKFNRLLNFLQCDEFKPKTKEQIELVNISIRKIVLTAKSFFYISIFTLLSFLIFPVIERSRRHPCPVKFPNIDVKESPIFEIVYAGVVVTLTGLATMNSSMDTLMAAFMSQAIAQLDCLNYSLLHIMDSPNKCNETNEISNEIVYNDEIPCQNIKKAIKHHGMILRYAADTEDMFNIALCFQYLVSGVVICCSGIQLVIIKPLEQPFKLVALLSYLATMLSEIFMMCWFGNEIMTKSASLSESIYNTSWMDGSHKFKQSMKIFMERAKVPMIITAGKLFKLNLQSFASILNSSYSYFALLRHMYTAGQKTEY